MRHLFQALIAILLLSLGNFSYAQCDGVIPLLCDADGDRDVDSDDIAAIGAASGEPVEPGDIRDIDGDGVITGLDARQCVARCDEEGCVSPLVRTLSDFVSAGDNLYFSEVLSSISEFDENSGIFFEAPIKDNLLEIFLSGSVTDVQYSALISYLEGSGYPIVGYSTELYVLQISLDESLFNQVIETVESLDGVLFAMPGYVASELNSSIYGYDAQSNSWEEFLGDDWVEMINVPPVWDEWLDASGGVDVTVGIVELGGMGDDRYLEGRLSSDFGIPGFHATTVTFLAAGKYVDEEDKGFGVYWGGDVILKNASRRGSFGFSDAAYNAGQLIDDGAIVINLSLGALPIGVQGSDTVLLKRQRNFRQTFRRVLQKAADNDVLMVFAAGNTNLLDDHLINPSKAGTDWGVELVENFEKIALNVSGSFLGADNGQYPWPGAVQGEAVDIYAPYFTTGINEDGSISGGLAGGTSNSAPLVTGSAALLKSMFPEKSMADIRAALVTGAGSLDGGEKKLDVAGAFAVLDGSAPIGDPVLNADNGHYYLFASTPMNYADAQALAHSSEYMGIEGHVVTITSPEENAFVLDLINGTGQGTWLGARLDFDSPTKIWYWDEGPEKDTPFWQNSSSGTPIDGSYANWLTQSPNNEPESAQQGDRAGMPDPSVSTDYDGEWADGRSSSLRGVVIEYSP